MESHAQPKVAMQHTEQHHEDKINEKIEAIQVEVATEHLNVIDFELLSRESINFKSKATLRLLLVIIIQGISKCPLQQSSMNFTKLTN
jgi:hypothetical protein